MIKKGILLVSLAVLFLYAAPLAHAATVIASQTDDSATGSVLDPYYEDYHYYLGTGFTGELENLKLRFDSLGNDWLVIIFCRTSSNFISPHCGTFGNGLGDIMTGGNFAPAPAGVADYTATWTGTHTFDPSKHYYFALLFSPNPFGPAGDFVAAPVLRGSSNPNSYIPGACDPIQSTLGLCDLVPDIYFELNIVTPPPSAVLSTVSVASNNANPVFAKVGDIVTVSFESTVELGTTSATIAGQSAPIASTSATTYTASYQLSAGDTEGPVAFSLSYTNLSGAAGFTTSTTTNASSVIFDKTAPVVDITAGPAEGAVVTQSTVEFSFSMTDSAPTTATCQFDTSSPAPCSSPISSVLSDGPHTFTVAAQDAAGNNSSVVRTFSVDTTPPPPTTGTLVVTVTTSGGDGTFNFSGDNGLGPFSVVTTGGLGQEEFVAIPAGTYHVTQTTPSGWTLGSNDCATVVVAAANTASCSVSYSKNTVTGTKGNIIGLVFNDKNGNGQFDRKSGEGSLLGSYGWRVYLDTNNNGVRDVSEVSKLTTLFGLYFFPNLTPGPYTVRLELKPGKILTTPASGYLSATVTAKQTTFAGIFGWK